MVVKNLPWVAAWEARAGYAGHLVRDLSNTHVMIVGGGHAHRDRRLLVRPAPRGATAAREQRPGARGVLVHRRRPARLLRRADRERDRYGPAHGARLGLRGGQGAHGQLVPGAGRRERGRDGGGLLVLRGQRGRDGLPGAARARAQAERAPLEVPAHRRRGAHRGHRAGRDPGAAEERRLALPGAARGRVDRSDQPCAHQPGHRAHDAGRRGPLLPPAAARRRRAAATARQPLLLAAPGRLARLLRHGALPRLPRGPSGGAARPHARAGRGGHAAAPVPDHGRRAGDARGLLDAAVARGALGVEARPARSGRSSSPAAAPSRSARSRGPCRRSRRSTSCSTRAATRAT